MSAVITSTDKWILGASGLWSTAADWSLQRAPAGGDNVDIEATTPYVVTLDVANRAVQGLTLSGASLDLEGGNLAVRGAASLQNASVVGVKALSLLAGGHISGFTVGGAALLYNYSALIQTGGSVTVGDSATSTARIYNLAGATWTITDTSGIGSAGQPGWGFVNRGLFQKTSTSGVALITANFLSTGTVSSAAGGDIEFDGRYTNLSGTFVGPGMIDYGPDGAAFIGNVQVTGSTCQTNWGSVYLIGDMTMYDGSTIMNEAGARWCFDGDVSLLLAAGQTAGPDIGGKGVIAKIAGTGVSQVGVNVAAQGVVVVAKGTLDFNGASSTFSSTVAGAGVFEIGGGAATIANGARLTVANWTLGGGTTTLGENVSYAGAFTGASGATLTLGGYNLTLTGATSMSGLAVNGAGFINLNAAATVAGLTLGAYVTAIDTAAVTLQSPASPGASLTIGDNATWSLQGAGSIALGANLSASIQIGGASGTGVLSRGGAGSSVVAASIVNNGRNIPSGSGFQPKGIQVSSGALKLLGAVTGTGSDSILGTGNNNQLTETTLEFDAAVGAGQTVAFSGSGAALFIKDLPEFHAAITGFNAFNGANSLLIGGGYVFIGATEGATSTTLSFIQAPGQAALTLTLTGDYRGANFGATLPDQNGVIRVM